jgi:putative transposase
MIEPEHPRRSVVRQCELVSISRSGFYYRPAGETPLNLALMRLIDGQFLETPWYGSRQMARHLRREGYTVGRKRVRRLMAKMGWSRSTSGRGQRSRIPATGSICICCGRW